MSDLIPPELIPPGVNDARSRAFAAAFGRLLADFSTSALLVQDAWTVPASFLPAMTVEAGVSDFVSPGMREELVRALIAAAPDIHAMTGTIAGVRRAFDALGVDVVWVQWWETEPKGHHDTHVVTAYVSDTILADEEMLFSAASQAALFRILRATQRWSQEIEFRIGVEAADAGRLAGCVSIGGVIAVSGVTDRQIDAVLPAHLAGVVSLAAVVNVTSTLH